MEERSNQEIIGLFREKYPFFLGACTLYALLYTFAFYKNNSGISIVLFAVGSVLFCFLLQKELHLSKKEGHLFYEISILLLSISSFSTMDGTILFFNQVGIFFLLICTLIHQFCVDKDWGFGKYFCAVFQTFFGAIGNFGGPILDAISWNKKKKVENKIKKKGDNKGKYLLIGFFISIPFLFIIGGLLISSDAVISDMTHQFFKELFGTFSIFDVVKKIWNLCIITGMILWMFFLSYGMISFLSKKKIKESTVNHRSGEPLIMIVFVGLLSLMYLFYSVIQILYLFLQKMTLPIGYTYAEYAREGFFQLLMVCLINLILVLICIRFFKKSMVLKILLTIVSICTYIMIASSFLRMIMYIRFYYFTYLRILVLWGLAVFFFLLTGLIISLYKEKFPLFKYSMVIITICYLLLAFGHPDYWIAKGNTANMEEKRSEFFLGESYDDYAYLSTLSLDAASIVEPLFEEEGYYFLIKEKDEMNFRTFNLSKFFAYH